MKQLPVHPQVTDSVVANAFPVLTLMGKSSTDMGVGMVLQVHVLNVLPVVQGFTAQDVEVYLLAWVENVISPITIVLVDSVHLFPGQSCHVMLESICLPFLQHQLMAYALCVKQDFFVVGVLVLNWIVQGDPSAHQWLHNPLVVVEGFILLIHQHPRPVCVRNAVQEVFQVKLVQLHVLYVMQGLWAQQEQVVAHPVILLQHQS
jgi:hypothetical protein